MAVPKSVTKISKDGTVSYTSSVELVQYTMQELIRGALRDTGKFIAKQTRLGFYNKHKKQTGRVSKGIAYWVRKREGDLQVGMGRKGIGFYGGLFEVGSAEKGIEKESNLRNAVFENIDTIIDIQSQYLSELRKDKPNLSGLSEGEYEGE